MKNILHLMQLACIMRVDYSYLYRKFVYGNKIPKCIFFKCQERYWTIVDILYDMICDKSIEFQTYVANKLASYDWYKESYEIA